MAFTEVSSEGWFSRIGSSIKGILFGIILFIAAFPLLFWNEGRAVHRAQSLAEGRGAVVTVAADKVDNGNEGNLVHATAMASTDETLTDPEFKISAEKAISLTRRVEMYQWEETKETETKKQAGGKKKTITTYDYDKVWSDRVIDSSGFKESGHDNPQSMPFQSHEEVASVVNFGAFKLGERLSSRIGGDTPISVTQENLNALSPTLAKSLVVNSGSFYSGQNPQQPVIGDTRISFESVPPATVSIIAVQQGDSFAPYTAEAGGSTIFELSMGEKTADEMFTALEQANAALTWILRGVGFLMLAFGVQMVLKPLAVIADVIPFIGNIVEGGIGILGFVIAAPFALITIAAGWIVYRPVIGIGLLVIAAGLGFAAFKMAQAKKSA